MSTHHSTQLAIILAKYMVFTHAYNCMNMLLGTRTLTFANNSLLWVYTTTFVLTFNIL